MHPHDPAFPYAILIFPGGLAAMGVYLNWKLKQSKVAYRAAKQAVRDAEAEEAQAEADLLKAVHETAVPAATHPGHDAWLLRESRGIKRSPNRRR